MKIVSLILPLLTLSCGYHFLTWNNSEYHSIHIRMVKTLPKNRPYAPLFQEALNDRCLAMSGLRLEDEDKADLILEPTLHQVQETIIATDIDRRVRQVQFTIITSFKLKDRDGAVLWNLENYRFSDQYEISTSRGVYRNDAAGSMNKAFQNIAELAVTHFSISLNRQDPNNG